MFSTKSAVVISTCSAGIGILLGRLSQNNGTNPSKDYFNFDNTSYVFPTASAKSAIVPTDDDLKVDIANDKVDKSKSQKNLTADFIKYGFPGLDNLRSYEDFILSYDKRTRNANWVLEHLTPEKVEKANVDRAHMKFKEDQSFHIYHRATNKDFQNSGYDRGHLAAAANHRHSYDAMSQTFLLSNVTPQVGEGFNRDIWNDLEKYTRAVARKSKDVFVCTGPLYLPRVEPDGKLYVKYEVIGDNHIAVPTHFFKVLLIESQKGEKEIQSFVLPNEKLSKVKLKDFMIPLETIERAAGLHFFEKIPKHVIKRFNTIQSK